MSEGSGKRIRGLSPEERRRQRREELLASALELFAAQGYAGTSIEQICQNAMVGYKAFYDEFATKELLFIELYDWIGGQLLPSVFEALAAEVPPEERLAGVIAAYIRAAMADRRLAKVLFLTSAGVSEAVDLHRRAAHRAFADFFSQIYRQGLVSDAPTIGVVNGHTMALGVTGAMGEIVVDHLLEPEGADVEQLIRDLTEFVTTLTRGIDRAVPPNSME